MKNLARLLVLLIVSLTSVTGKAEFTKQVPNSLSVYNTMAGPFRVVSSYFEYSTDPMKMNEVEVKKNLHDGIPREWVTIDEDLGVVEIRPIIRFQMLQLPSGDWVQASPNGVFDQEILDICQTVYQHKPTSIYRGKLAISPLHFKYNIYVVTENNIYEYEEGKGFSKIEFQGLPDKATFSVPMSAHKSPIIVSCDESGRVCGIILGKKYFSLSPEFQLSFSDVSYASYQWRHCYEKTCNMPIGGMALPSDPKPFCLGPSKSRHFLVFTHPHSNEVMHIEYDEHGLKKPIITTHPLFTDDFDEYTRIKEQKTN